MAVVNSLPNFIHLDESEEYHAVDIRVDDIVAIIDKKQAGTIIRTRDGERYTTPERTEHLKHRLERLSR